MLSGDKYRKVYSTGKLRVEALNDVSIRLRRGAFASITGASGSDKSTLLNLIGGLDTASYGTIEVEGRRISDMNRNELAGILYIDYFHLPLWLCLGAIAFSIAVSLVSGIYPAVRAARIDPVAVLRHD